MGDHTVQISTIQQAIELACRAPSLHNSQPWRWVARCERVELFADPARVLRSADRMGREAILSCGIVLDHFRAAMASLGWAARIERFPDHRDIEHLASITFEPKSSVSDRERRCADAILVRRTDRLPFAEPPGWDSFEQYLRREVATEVTRLDVLTEDQRPQLVEATQLTESLRLYDTSYHNELYWWSGEFESVEGIPFDSLLSVEENERVDIARRFPPVSHRQRRISVGQDKARIVVLSTYDGTRDSVLRCGETLSAVLLEATMTGFATCPLTHLTELAVSRNLVAALTGADTIPQVLIRIGLAPALEPVAAPTPRRPLTEVLTIDDDP
ncbi:MULTISPECIES: Acg family FMN-binding oxidoreductase [Mycolicibacterium]|uniref:Acg family FMN-binding oxidoreductase n=1 Tax=Mycolicibacterium TaxID=1866885 RepID=UPI00148FB175|nr:NAD(P)H nitroreductase [Mycolicibacterium fortuitum]